MIIHTVIKIEVNQREYVGYASTSWRNSDLLKIISNSKKSIKKVLIERSLA